MPLQGTGFLMFDNTNNDLPYDYEVSLPSPRGRKWPPITSELHDRIKGLYQSKRNRSGEVREFAARHGLPRWKVTRYAIRKGWIPKQKKEPAWSDAELRILKKHAQHCPETIQKYLTARGFKRSVTGIVLKRRRMRLVANLDGQSAWSLAMCLGEDVHFVMTQIRSGRLKASVRKLHRTPQQGGNPYLIKDRDVRDFIVGNVNLIDLRKTDKYWLIDLLSSSD